jgi:hypothetical protein
MLERQATAKQLNFHIWCASDYAFFRMGMGRKAAHDSRLTAYGPA